MRRFRIRALLAAAAGFAALPIVGPLMSVIRNEWEAAIDRGDSLEREADAANARTDAANKIIRVCEETHEEYARSATNLVGDLRTRLAATTQDRDSLASRNVELRAESAKAQALHAASSKLVAAQMAEAKTSIDELKGIALAANERAAVTQRETADEIVDLRKFLYVAREERDAARKERDELALRLAAETERCTGLEIVIAQQAIKPFLGPSLSST